MALADNLISFWALDEASGNATDSHGTNTLTQNGSVGATTGKVSGARNGFSSSNYFDIPDNASISTGDIDFTLAGWFYMTTVTAATIIEKASSGAEWQVYYYPSVSAISFWVYGTGFSYISATNFGIPSTNTWHFLAAWHDSVNNSIGISVNNGTANTTSYSGGASDTTDYLRIGNGFNGPWPGSLDNWGFWKRVLTSAEITDLYNSGSGRDYAYISGGGGGGATVSYLTLLGVG